jgi:hypothetical protein
LAKSVRSKKQVRADRAALKKLRESGLFTGKIDLRKPPSRGAKRALAKFADVFSGKAKVVKPADPKAYKGAFRVVGDKVIVPRKKGERVKLDKGEIVVEKKIRGRTRKQRFLDREKVASGAQPLKLNRRYGLPFKRGKRDEYTIRWFPSKAELQAFMLEYEYEDWEDYVIEEAIDYEPAFETSDVGRAELDRISKVKARRGRKRWERRKRRKRK